MSTAGAGGLTQALVQVECEGWKGTFGGSSTGARSCVRWRSRERVILGGWRRVRYSASRRRDAPPPLRVRSVLWTNELRLVGLYTAVTRDLGVLAASLAAPQVPVIGTTSAHFPSADGGPGRCRSLPLSARRLTGDAATHLAPRDLDSRPPSGTNPALAQTQKGTETNGDRCRRQAGTRGRRMAKDAPRRTP